MQKNSEENRLIRLSKSILSDIEKDAVKKVLDEGLYFEKKLQYYQGLAMD